MNCKEKFKWNSSVDLVLSEEACGVPQSVPIGCLSTDRPTRYTYKQLTFQIMVRVCEMQRREFEFW